MTNKILLLALALMIVLATVSFSSALSPNDPDNVAYYTFDEGNGSIAYNSVVNKYIFNSSNISWSAGKIGNATSFNGSQIYIDTDFFPAFNYTFFSVSYWFKFNNFTNNNQRVIGYTDGANYGFSMEKTAGQNTVDLWGKSNGAWVSSRSPVLTAGLWYHAVLVFNSTHQLLYINGTLVDFDIDALAGFGHNVLGLGCNPYSCSSAYSFDGSIDELYIINRSISSDEVLSLYNNFSGFQMNFDVVSPNGTLIQPIDNLYTNTTLVNFTINATDNIALANVTLFIYNNTVLVNSTTQTVSGTQGIFGLVYDFIFDGVFKWFYKVVDVAGNIFTTGNRTLIIDTAYPQLNIHYPINATNYPYVIANITHSVNETNLANCSFGNGGALITITCNQIFEINSTEGNNEWNITAMDLAGQSYTRRVIFLVDTIYPTINFSAGTLPDLNITDNHDIFVNVSVQEDNFYSIRYILANPTQIISDVTFYSQINSTLYPDLVDGDYYYNVSVQDVVGHISSTETRILTIETIPITEEQEPSYLINGSGLIYETAKSSGAGFGKFVQYLGQSIPALVILLVLVGIIIAFAVVIKLLIFDNLKKRAI